ncbi:hypothetical protein [Algisphaera agarilytica]|uniref:Methyltransferase, FkbM family n=1 Tax=Algisphaera agarilytica TaxID=1385975 RepID=A0A7X0LIN5_9BACT|nr:hypothetical protein [Algisphaera agarilytica]MBB6428400.1 hypothetical protein [Algisphaera agarilytica]
MLRRWLSKLRDPNTPAHSGRDLEQAINGLREEVSRLNEKVESIRVHTWIDKEAGIIQAQDVAIMTAPRYADPKCLVPHQTQMFSQNGEDGIIAEVFRRVGTSDRFFVEIGVGDGLENNTRLLLQIGWRGVWIEADESAVAQARQHFSEELADGRLKIVSTAVTRENVADVLRGAEVPEAFDFVSLDIDMNTGHVWEALLQAGYQPRVACVEYNASVPPSVDWQVPYDPAGQWTDGSNYFGAGLKTLERISREAGMSLVGCEYLGANAFFVRQEDLGDHFLEPFTAERHYEPPRFSLLNHRGHRKHKS